MTEKNRELSLEEIHEIIINEAEEALKDPYVFKNTIKNVAVIGAGPAGLASARRMKDLGLNVKVFERNSDVGGIWVYSERPPVKAKMPTSRVTRKIDPSLKSIKEPQKKIYEMTPELKNLLLTKIPPSAVYRDLYNNTATGLSELPDFHYPEGTPDYVPHHVIRDYYESYAEHFDLLPLCVFDTSVDLVEKKGDKWELVVSKYDVYTSGMVREQKWRESFDAVVVASGQYHNPYVPDFADLTAYNKIYPEKLMHSEQYRRPEDYKDKNVLVVGGSISAVDIVRAIDGIANNVTMSIMGPFETPSLIFNLIRSAIPKSVSIKPNIEAFSNKEGQIDGMIRFEDGSHIKDIDQVIFCTGFLNRVPFLGDLVIDKVPSDDDEPQLYDDVPESHVVMGPKCPLNVYHEVFVMSDPTLAFVGQPPAFSCPAHFDAQANAVARVWSGHAFLPKNMNKLAAGYRPGLSPFDLFDSDRRRREPFVAWLNHHAGDSLPKVENFPEDYEEQGQEQVKIWVKTTTEIFQKTKQKILKDM